MSGLEAFNRTMFLHINGSDDSPAWLIQVAIALTNYLIYLIPLLVLGLWLWSDHVRRSKRSLRHHFPGMAHDC